jgi:hypothetical protein
VVAEFGALSAEGSIGRPRSRFSPVAELLVVSAGVVDALLSVRAVK